MQLTPLGDGALILEVGRQIDEPTRLGVQAVMTALEKANIPGVIELVPAYTTVTLFYDPLLALEAGAPATDVTGWLAAQVRSRTDGLDATATATTRCVELPACYEAGFGPDLAEVARRTGLAPEEVVRRHTSAEFVVHMLGFSPGFAYMGGLPAELALPRRDTPRPAVPAGSVGIVNNQTCVYPHATPGGWNLIARTPLRMFDPVKDPPVRLRAGDRVRFKSISADEFAKMEDQQWA